MINKNIFFKFNFINIAESHFLIKTDYYYSDFIG